MGCIIKRIEMLLGEGSIEFHKKMEDITRKRISMVSSQDPNNKKILRRLAKALHKHQMMQKSDYQEDEHNNCNFYRGSGKKPNRVVKTTHREDL